MEITPILILIGGILITLIGIWLSIRFIKKHIKRKQLKEIPEQLLSQLDNIERRYQQKIQNGEQSNPYSTIWEETKNAGGIRVPINTGTTSEQPAKNRELCSESDRRQDIPSGTSTGNAEDNNIIRKTKSNNLRDFLSRIRRNKTR